MKLGTDISNQQAIDLSTDAIRRHLYVVGKSGTGKSVLLEHIIFELLNLGWGFCVIDPHGDLAEKIADTIPENRFNYVIYFDPANLEHVIGYNPLTHTGRDQRPLVADNVLSAFAHVWGLGHTPHGSSTFCGTAFDCPSIIGKHSLGYSGCSPTEPI
jgi:hypothetical protein